MPQANPELWLFLRPLQCQDEKCSCVQHDLALNLVHSIFRVQCVFTDAAVVRLLTFCSNQGPPAVWTDERLQEKLAVFSSTLLEYAMSWVRWHVPVILPLQDSIRLSQVQGCLVRQYQHTNKENNRGIPLESYGNSSSLKWSKVPLGFGFYQ